MSNWMAVLCYAPLAALNAYVLCTTLRHDRGKRMAGNVVFLTSSLLGWLLVGILWHTCRGPFLSQYLYSLNLPFVAFSSMAVLLFTIRLYNMEAYHTRTVILLLGIFPFLTTIYSLTSPFHSFVRQNMHIVQYTPLLEISSTRGPWFWVHATYCYLTLIVAFLIVIRQLKSLPKIYLRSTFWLSIGLCGSLVGNVITLLQVFPLPLDFSLIGGSIATIFLTISVRTNQGLDTLNRAKAQLFDEMDDAMWILDDAGQIVHRNTAAKYMQFFHNVPQDEPLFAIVKQKIFTGAQQIVRQAVDNGGTDYTLFDHGEETIYNLHQNRVHDRRGRLLSTVVICSDVTENRHSISRLESGAGLDALTGILNRRSMEEHLQQLNDAGQLPFSVLLGDLNGLKRVNDRMGHSQGDVFLRVAAETLARIIPPSALAARWGGDEFLVLLPGYTLPQAEALIEEIQGELKSIQNLPFRISMALGAATKNEPQQTLDAMLQQADQAMYQNKRTFRRRRTNR